MRIRVPLAPALLGATLALVAFVPRPATALDPALRQECEEFVLSTVEQIGQTKAAVRERLAEFLNLKVACQAGTVDQAACDRKVNKLILKVERLTEKLDAQIEKFFDKLFEKLPECDAALSELGVDDFNLF